MARTTKKMAGARLSPNTPTFVARKVSFVILLWCGLIGVGIFLREQILKDKHFALSQVMVRNNHRASEEEVFERSGLRLGHNVFMVDINGVERRLANSGWIQKAQISRILPSTIRIDVEEFQPVAMVALGELFYLDDSGKAFRTYVPGEEIDLPVLVGLDREGYERGSPVVMDKIQSGLDFIPVWRKVFESTDAVLKTVEVGEVGLVSYTDQNGAEVFVGPAPWEQALADARDTFKEFKPGSIATMYLVRGSDTRRITVKLRKESERVGSWSGNRYVGGR